MKLFPGHPGLSDDINKNIAISELLGGVWLKDILVGQRVVVQTKNTRYEISRLEDGLLISGNAKYCPEPTRCNIAGSTWGGSMLKMGFIGAGMYLEFSTESHPFPIITSEIQSVEVLEAQQ